MEDAIVQGYGPGENAIVQGYGQKTSQHVESCQRAGAQKMSSVHMCVCLSTWVCVLCPHVCVGVRMCVCLCTWVCLRVQVWSISDPVVFIVVAVFVKTDEFSRVSSSG